MKNLFYAGAKLLGLFALFRSLFFIPTLAIGLFSLIDPGNSSSSHSFIVYSLLGFLFYLVFGLFLAIKTDRLAEIFKINEDPIPSIDLSKTALFKIGVTLLGLYFFISSFPRFLSAVYIVDKSPDGWSSSHPKIGDLIVSALTTILGVILVTASNTIIRFITKNDVRPGETPPA